MGDTKRAAAAAEAEIHPSKSLVRAETVRLHHVVSVPRVLLLADAPFVSDWFSNDRLSSDDLTFRVGVDAGWAAGYDSYGRSSSSHERHIWVHVATNSDKRFYSEQKRGRVERAESEKQETGFIIDSMNICMSNVQEETLLDTRWSGGSVFLAKDTYYVLSLKLKKSCLADVADQATLFLDVKVNLVRSVLGGGEEGSRARAPPGGHGHSEAVLRKLLEGALLTDVTFKVGKEELKAHRVVLAANSPRFEAMFTGDFEEKRTGEVVVKDFRPEVVRAALQAMYLGSLTGKLGTEMYLDLARLADFYVLPHLKGMCEDRLMSEPSLDLLQVLLFADVNNSPRLKEHIMRRILNHPARQQLMQDEELMTIMSTRPELMGELMKAMAAGSLNF